ncbi:PEGA domain protein [Roseimaritima multifibrata]|uniref:PEGA domain protein n=1 Tax=Roseimaritima multifibrata TaxID=1930274 RepID=A0A517MN78_9BACT|nr:PEGA domain-containing protein [Roseimaritima multifibrata]QDS96330.1 PEGA domain protein [Roseimaritima multifibrata]
MGISYIPTRKAGLIATIAMTVVASGCVRRRMTVRTTPPGAIVSVDNQTIGTSPASSSFTYYGTREFRIEKDGYETETIQRRLNPPWYEYPPLDFITETLWPWEIRDERIIDIELVPKKIPAIDEVLGRADQLRGQARSGVVTAPLETTSPPTLPLPSTPQGLPQGGVPAVIGN